MKGCIPAGSAIYYSEKELPLQTSKDVEYRARLKAYGESLDKEAMDAEILKQREGEGQLAKVAASILMGLLYAARMARFDLLRVTCRLATSTEMSFLNTIKRYNTRGNSK